MSAGEGAARGSVCCQPPVPLTTLQAGFVLPAPADTPLLSLFLPNRFDTVYIDEQIRVAQDSRGDTLVVARDGPPRRFS